MMLVHTNKFKPGKLLGEKTQAGYLWYLVGWENLTQKGGRELVTKYIRQDCCKLVSEKTRIEKFAEKYLNIGIVYRRRWTDEGISWVLGKFLILKPTESSPKWRLRLIKGKAGKQAYEFEADFTTEAAAFKAGNMSEKLKRYDDEADGIRKRLSAKVAKPSEIRRLKKIDAWINSREV